MRNTLPPITEDVRLAQYVMGTVVEVVVSPIAGADHARDAAMAALCEFERIEGIFSRFDSRSELCRVNRLAAEREVSVSEEFVALLSRGLQYARHCAAAFSICLQPLVDLWEKSSRSGIRPAPCELEKAMFLSRPERVMLDETRRTVRFSNPGVGLNFDGLAKGYAVDRARGVLSSYGITRGMINAGSSSIALLQPPGNSACVLGVRHPVNGRACAARFVLKHPAVSTSATNERGGVIGGRWHSHVIDPASGCPIRELVSATVAGEFAELMEVASKMVLLRGCRQGLETCDRFGWVTDAIVLREQDRGLLIEHPDSLSVTVDSKHDTHPPCVF